MLRQFRRHVRLVLSSGTLAALTPQAKGSFIFRLGDTALLGKKNRPILASLTQQYPVTPALSARTGNDGDPTPVECVYYLCHYIGRGCVLVAILLQVPPAGRSTSRMGRISFTVPPKVPQDLSSCVTTI